MMARCIRTAIRTGADVKRKRILIVGLGNELLMDDGVGVHTVRAIKGNLPTRAICAEVGTFVLDALHLLEWADKILAIDAMQAGGRPGTVYRFGASDVDAGGIMASLHEVNLISALGFIENHRQPEIIILGVEPENIRYGLDLSPSVASAIPQVVLTAIEIVAGWRQEALETVVATPLG